MNTSSPTSIVLPFHIVFSLKETIRVRRPFGGAALTTYRIEAPWPEKCRPSTQVDPTQRDSAPERETADSDRPGDSRVHPVSTFCNKSWHEGNGDASVEPTRRLQRGESRRVPRDRDLIDARGGPGARGGGDQGTRERGARGWAAAGRRRCGVGGRTSSLSGARQVRGRGVRARRTRRPTAADVSASRTRSATRRECVRRPRPP